MVRVGDFEVALFSGDYLLPEFDDPKAVGFEFLNALEACNEVYVEATADAEFGFQFTILPQPAASKAKDFVFDIFLDGKPRKLGSCLAFSEDFSDEGWTCCWEGRKFARGQTWKIQRLRFGQLHANNDSATSLEQHQASDIGTFKIKVWEFKRGSLGQAKTHAQNEKMETVPEEVFKQKGLDLGVSTGEPVEDKESVERWNGHRIGKKPLATLVLKYRSHEALQQLGVVPRSPSPIPLDHDDLDGLTIDELKKRLRQLQQTAVGTTRKIKEETTTGIKKEVAEHRSTKRQARSPTVNATRPRASTSETGLLNESFAEVERHLETIMGGHSMTPKKLRTQTQAALFSLKLLRTKLMTDEPEEDNNGNEDTMVTDGPARGPAPGREVISLSDSE